VTVIVVPTAPAGTVSVAVPLTVLVMLPAVALQSIC